MYIVMMSENWPGKAKIPLPKRTQEQWRQLPSPNDSSQGTFDYDHHDGIYDDDVDDWWSIQKAAEAHLPALEYKEGIPIRMEDLDGLHVWTFKYRYFHN